MKQRFINLITDMSLKISSMQRFLKLLAVLAVLLTGVRVSHGFALLGPFEPYQTILIGYAQPYSDSGLPGVPESLQDLGGPHNLGEEFRRNVPVLYYACDGNFGEYFGSNGVAAIDQAFAIMNSLTNVSQYSPELFEFPLEAQRINYQAENLFLTDVKSITLHLLVEQMGLAQPERYTWTLHDRFVGPPPGCPLNMFYLVVQRNYDIVPSPLNHVQASSYVNGTLYSYGIVEVCAGSPTLAVTVPYAVDPLAETYTAIAADAFTLGSGFNGAGLNIGGVGLHIGGFYNFLTRDDVGGLRYLLQTNNYNLESSGPDTVQFVTNNSPQFLVTQDLGLLLAQGATNSAAQLQALYPGLLVTDTTNFFKVVNVPVVSLVVTTPPPFAPANTFLVIAVTNIVPTIVQFFGHTYDNIITNKFSTHSVQALQTVTFAPSPFAPVGSPPTVRTTTATSTVNRPSGDFYIIPTNLCAIKILNSHLLTTVVATTNTTFTLTNSAATGVTNSFTVSTISYFTNHTIVYLPVSCPANTAAIRQGIEQVRFVRRDFDSLIGTFWTPITDTYSMVELTNNTLRSQQIRRVVTRPDFLFTADDLALGPNAIPFVGTVTRFMNFNQVASNGIAGPGTIQSPTTITFNKVGPIFQNNSSTSLFPFFLTDEASQFQGIAWGSFDGTTNDPVVYPNGTSINSFINQLVIQVQPRSLPNGRRGVPYTFTYTNSVSGVTYSNTLSATGGQPPYTWSLSPASAGGLPPGLNLSAAGVLDGTPSGGTRSTTYDFTIRMTDAGARFVDVPLSITITP